MFISYKSEKITEEMKQAEKAIAILGGKVKSQTEIYLPDSDIYRNLFAIEKVAACAIVLTHLMPTVFNHFFIPLFPPVPNL